MMPSICGEQQWCFCILSSALYFREERCPVLPSRGQLKQFGMLRKFTRLPVVVVLLVSDRTRIMRLQCRKMKMFMSYQSKVQLHMHSCMHCRAVIFTRLLKLFCRQDSYCAIDLFRAKIFSGLRCEHFFFLICTATCFELIFKDCEFRLHLRF